MDTNNNPDSDKMYKRMLELREMYDVQRKELGIPFANKDEDNNSEPIDIQDDSTEEDSAKKKRRISNREMKTITNGNNNSQQLQTMIRTIIEKHGGSCHLETIVENIKIKWQRENLLKSDGTPLGHADCKKAVQANFRTKVNNRFVFSRDKENEGCWIITPDDDSDAIDPRYKPLAEIVAESIEDHGGLCQLEDIFVYVRENWKTAPSMTGELASNERDHQILLTLSTNPRFYEDSDNADFYQIASKKKRKAATESEKRSGNGSKKKMAEEDLVLRSRNPRRAVRDENPPSGYSCRCGATEPGNSSLMKWVRGSNGEFQCNSCISSSNKKLACPVCGKMYNPDLEDQQANDWIRCDDCHRWVMTKCDTIVDLSLFDDSNPNHLHYSCPVCRREAVGLFNNPPKEKEIKELPPPVKEKPKKKNEKTNIFKSVKEEMEQELEVIEDPALNSMFPLGKIENLEREIMRRITESNDIDTIEDDEMREKLELHEYSFSEEMGNYVAMLINKRDRDWHKNQLEVDRGIKKLKEERERKDEFIELDLLAELKAHFRKEKKEFDKQREKILRSFS